MQKNYDIRKLKLIMADLERALSQNFIYREQGLTIHRVAQLIDHPAYLISQAINRIARKKFNAYVNDYRINEIAIAIKNGSVKKFTIEGLATRAGFTCLSSFYESFKKSKKCTPLEYQRLQESAENRSVL